MGTTPEETHWRLCSTCKKPIPFSHAYYACSVSTCNRKRTFLTFCCVNCWQAHLPILRHRDAWAQEKRAPSREQWQEQQAEEERSQEAKPIAASASTSASKRRVVQTEREFAEPCEIELNERDIPKDTLIVASKLKTYIRARSGMNTSESVLRVLSDQVRELTDQAIRNAAQDGRKTVMDRDY
jgi:hypothetical protein